ncbi:MAG: ABC transporter permease [Armatimonadota bacterium]
MRALLRRFLPSAANLFFRYGIIAAFVLLCLFFAVAKSEFISVNNIINVANQVSIVCILAVGMTFVIITAGIDLSVGWVTTLANVIAAFVLMRGVYLAAFGYRLTLLPADAAMALMVPCAISSAIVVGAALGAVNGVAITRIGLPPFIATLAMMTIARGLGFAVTGYRPIGNLHEAYTAIGQSQTLVVPIPVLIMAGIIGLGYVLLTQTRFGRHVFAIGGNEEAARLSGIAVNRVKMGVYSMMGAFAGIGGIIYSSTLGSGDPKAGQAWYELDAIAAVVVGGTSLMGGSGSIFGTVVGAFIIQVLNNGLSLMGVEQYWQWIVKGLVIAAAVSLDRMKR